MICFRRSAIRVLLTPYSSIAAKPRSITTFSQLALRTSRPTFASAFQKRFASEDVTQNEPEADGATEAQHGENSIADSTNHEAPESADQEDQSAIASAVSSAAETVSEQASQAAEYVQDSAAAVASLGTAMPTGRNSLGGTPSKEVYLGNLFFDVTEEMIRKEFQRFGEITRSGIVRDARGLSKGFGHVHFADIESATRAVNAMDAKIFEGRRLSVQFSRARAHRPENGENVGSSNPPSKTLFIGNMSFEMTDQDLNDMFRDIRNVIDVRVAIDRRTGQPRGFAHADFVDVASAEKAKDHLAGKEIYGRMLRIDFSLPSSNSMRDGDNRGDRGDRGNRGDRRDRGGRDFRDSR